MGVQNKGMVGGVPEWGWMWKTKLKNKHEFGTFLCKQIQYNVEFDIACRVSDCIQTIPWITAASSTFARGLTEWKKNMVRSSGLSHCWELLPATGGSAKAITRNEGWMGKIRLCVEGKQQKDDLVILRQLRRNMNYTQVSNSVSECARHTSRIILHRTPPCL